MKDKAKNIASNAIGLIIIGLSVYALIYQDLKTFDFCVLMLFGLGLFLFKVRESKKWLIRLLEKKL